MNKNFSFLTRILPLLILAPIVYFLWDKFGADALQNSVSSVQISTPIRVNTQAPNFSVSKERIWSKQSFQLNSLKSNPIILHFWATWCGPCLQELPDLLSAAQKLRLQGYQFIAVAMDESWADIEQFFQRNPQIAQLKDNAILILDPKAQISSLYGTSRFPETFLINDQFIIDNKFTGAQPWNSTDMTKYFQRLKNTGGPQ